ncbi:hypothetical protein CRG98_008481 [Punica granatum]|uniref:Uncharacterized protein n=1 Tax=Punica granatum TaxID=22663 RepID=A0A2I0KS57_PUNGR|nr:hypothetical protein CRG98_008481 [Punica granatum]
MGCRAWGTLNSGSPIITTLEWLDRDWGLHSCTFPDCKLACAALLGKARGAGSQEDRRVEQRRVGWAHSPAGSVTVQMTPVAGGQGHAPFIGAVAYDLSWREDQSSVFGVQGGSREEKWSDEGANYARATDRLTVEGVEDRKWSIREDWHDSPNT